MTGVDARRDTFRHDGLELSYLDTGPAESSGPARGTAGRTLLALHGHLNEARFIDRGAVPDRLSHRVVALDQRGHGDSDHADSYEVGEYVGDALALMDHLGLDQVDVLGHSLGGVIAFSLAATVPERVSRLVIVDIGADNDGDLTITTTWPHRARSRAALVDAFGQMGANQAYVMREYPDGWGVPWTAEDMVASQTAMNGDRWADWSATTMPALLIHGRSSFALTEEQARRMVRVRPHTELVDLDGGHAIYVDAAAQYSQRVREFLDRSI